MKNPRPVHFEVFADDPERVGKFYGDVFGWKIEKWQKPDSNNMDYWMVMTGEKGTMGIDGGIGKRIMASSEGGANAFVCTMAVDNFDEYQQKILAAGGKVKKEKYEIPQVGTHGYFADTDGNIFGILEPGEEMKKMGEMM
ncbi:MAG: Glyoxalase/bleomycin resistance protein [uncultured bacterium]|nr:MAG: Glyoxalase/bleomycin resistance protein [uncultured bacterium]